LSFMSAILGLLGRVPSAIAKLSAPSIKTNNIVQHVYPGCLIVRSHNLVRDEINRTRDQFTRMSLLSL
jgi:hypothetical protein